METIRVETIQELEQELKQELLEEFGRIYTEDDFINDEELIAVGQ